MSYPKPGDFAVVIADPAAKDGKTNVGRKLFMERFYTPETLLEALMQQLYGQLCVVTTLETFWALTENGQKGLNSPGQTLITVHKHLQKIEPLCAPEANYEASKTGEAEAFAKDLDRALDKLVEVLTNP